MNNWNAFLIRSLALATAAVAAGGCAMQETRMGAGPAPAVAAAPALVVPAADLTFARTAAGHGLYEVEVARVALSRASDPRVREYAQMLVDHHTMANNELITLMRSKNVVVTRDVPAPLQARINQLSQLSGATFDRSFIRNVGLDDHARDIALFEQASGTLADADLRAWAQKTLPVLRQHRQAAEQLAGMMMG